MRISDWSSDVCSSDLPLLAESYEWIDEKTLEFRLRKGITFHNGEPFDADDVVYTLNRVSSPEAAVVNPKMVNWIGSAEKVDDFTVRVLMEEPDRKSTRLNSSH